MTTHTIAESKEAWLEARKELLAEEKKYTRAGDKLAARRRALPWLPVTKDYSFDTPSGKQSLSDLFAGRSQLIVYQFMFDPDWEEGCKSCSFWSDHFAGVIPHLNARDVTLVAISRAPLAKLQAFAKRLGWNHTWVSSLDSDFNYDFGVSFHPEDLEGGDATYNFAPVSGDMAERHGISVFARDQANAIFHTYSCYARGAETVNTTYRYLDLAPKGRDEDQLPWTMSWVRFRDEYGV